MADFGCPTLVARDDELTTLRASLDGAARGQGAMLGILGEAGIGKSRLVLTVAEEAGPRGMPVLTGRAVETGAPMPFRPLFEALSGYFRRVGDDAHPELARLRHTLSPIVPTWSASDQSFVASPPELGEALLQVLMGIGADRGVVLALEDLHWADPDTAAVLEYVGDNVSSTGILCLATLRADTDTDALRVLRRLASRRAATLLELDRLGGAACAEMTRRCLGADAVPDDVLLMVQRFSDGVPFLVEELLATAVAGGTLLDAPDGWTIDAGAERVMPKAFEELVRERLGRLAGDDVRALSAAALLGPTFDAELLPTVTGQSFEAALETLRHGVAAQLLTSSADDPRAFSFRHSLTRDALLGQLLPVEQLALARKVLAAIEAAHPDLPGSLCELAADLAAQIGDSARAAELLLLAARRAVRRGALASAEPVLDRAWRLAAGAHQLWTEIGLELIAVLCETGDVDRALEVGGRLLAELPDGPERAKTHLGMARAATAAGRWAVAIQNVERARHAAPDDAGGLTGATADVLAAEIAIGQDDYAAAESLAKAALAVAERASSHELACRALLLIGQCARIRDADAGEEWWDRAIDLATAHDLTTWRLRAAMERASLDIWRFQTQERIVAARADASDSGALVVAAHLDNFLAWWGRDHHEPDSAEAAAERCIGLARKLGLGALEGAGWCASAVAAAQRGDRPAMEQRLAAAAALGDVSPDVSTMSIVARAWYWLGRDDLARAAVELDEAMDLLRRSPDLPTPDRGLWALLRAFQDRDGEAALAELTASSAYEHAMNRAYAGYAEAILRGRRGDLEAADFVTRGDQVATPLGWFQHHARRLVAEAALTDGWGEPVRWLHEALACFEAGRDDDLAAACRTLLARAGAPVPRRAAAAGDVPPDLAERGVSARELEVLEHLARAASTKDIAAALYLSPKTVERHIANLATKLLVSGRSGLVAFAAARLANGGGSDR